MSWRVVDAKWDGIRRRVVEGAGMMAIVHNDPADVRSAWSLPEICQKLRHP